MFRLVKTRNKMILLGPEEPVSKQVRTAFLACAHRTTFSSKMLLYYALNKTPRWHVRTVDTHPPTPDRVGRVLLCPVFVTDLQSPCTSRRACPSWWFHACTVLMHVLQVTYFIRADPHVLCGSLRPWLRYLHCRLPLRSIYFVYGRLRPQERGTPGPIMGTSRRALRRASMREDCSSRTLTCSRTSTNTSKKGAISATSSGRRWVPER